MLIERKTLTTDKDKNSSDQEKEKVQETDTLSTEDIVIPDLQLTVTTYQLVDNNIYEAILSHTFHGSTHEELFAIMEAHKEDDVFFRSSFSGLFTYKGEIIYLKNSEMKVAYP
jgi:hypothetical protein